MRKVVLPREIKKVFLGLIFIGCITYIIFVPLGLGLWGREWTSQGNEQEQFIRVLVFTFICFLPCGPIAYLVEKITDVILPTKR